VASCGGGLNRWPREVRDFAHRIRRQCRRRRARPRRKAPRWSAERRACVSRQARRTRRASPARLTRAEEARQRQEDAPVGAPPTPRLGGLEDESITRAQKCAAGTRRRRLFDIVRLDYDERFSDEPRTRHTLSRLILRSGESRRLEGWGGPFPHASRRRASRPSVWRRT